LLNNFLTSDFPQKFDPGKIWGLKIGIKPFLNVSEFSADTRVVTV
jgi:hypothetical protein